MKSNYHTHNYRCNHADGTVEDYVLEAIKEGFHEIGISDHLPHPGKDFDDSCRMTYEEIPGYMKDIDEVIRKYGDKISIKKGMECEYFAEYSWLYKELIEKYEVDYLLLGAHFFPYKGQWIYAGRLSSNPEMLEIYVDYVIESMESGLFKCLAHPDLFGIGYIDWDEHAIKQSRRILQAAQELDMPIEINVNGLRKPQVRYNKGKRCKYPIKDFWELSKEYNVKRIVGIDAHNPCEMGDLDMGLRFAKELGLEVIEKLDF